jgi:6-phosphogluconolactonase
MVTEKTICADTQELAEAASTQIVDILREALTSKPRASLVLTGGQTPRATYRLLDELHHDAIDWQRVDLFWGDERFVPLEHAESNFRLAAETLLRRIDVGEAFPVPTLLDSPAEAAAAYERDIRRYFADGEVSFDLTLLGLGGDAHVASLFPGAPELEEMELLVVPATAPPGNPIRDRVSLTFRALNASSTILFIVAGVNKREAVRKALAGDHGVPGGRIAPRDRLLWHLDAEAAGTLR